MARRHNPTTVMLIESVFGTVRATRSCNAAQISSVIAAQVRKEVGTAQEMMMSLLIQLPEFRDQNRTGQAQLRRLAPESVPQDRFHSVSSHSVSFHSVSAAGSVLRPESFSMPLTIPRGMRRWPLYRRSHGRLPALTRPGDQSSVLTALNVLVRLVPKVETATMITTAIKAAIKPYSIAVTARRSKLKAASLRARAVRTYSLIMRGP